MGRRLAIVAEPDVAALAGVEGTFTWGEARLLAPGATIAAGGADAIVALGDVPADPPDGVPLVRWLATTASTDATQDTAAGPPADAPAGSTDHTADSQPAGTVVGLPADVSTAAGSTDRAPAGQRHRIVAPAGDGLWRRSPWPAADALFELRRSPEAGALVVGPTGAERDGVAAKLEARAVAFEVRERLTRDALERASVVVLLGSPGEPLPALAPAVAATGRVLIAPRAEPAFGLLAGIDHLAYDNEDELAQLVDLAVTWPHALETVTAMGRIAAEPHRASAVYGRLAIDLELEAAAPAAP